MIDLLIPLASVLVIILGIYAIVKINDEDIKRAQNKEDCDYNRKMLSMCIKTKAEGKCPNCCLKCSWGTRMEDGVIYFSKGERDEKKN